MFKLGFKKVLRCILPKRRFVGNVSGTRTNSTCELALNQLHYDTVQISAKGKQLAKNGTILPIEQTKNKPNLIDAYEIRGDNFQYLDGRKLFDVDNMKFVEEVNPKMLKKKSIPSDEDVIFISNFDEIGGTIAATTDLDKCIATDRMYQCAGLSIVDKSLNKQTLIHVFPGFSVESNKAIIEKVLAGSKPENLELSIIPGCQYYTEDTVAFLADVTKKLVPEAKINFCNFPAVPPFHPEKTRGRVRFFKGEAAVWLKDGKLFCCNNDEIPNKIVNPKEFLTYFN